MFHLVNSYLMWRGSIKGLKVGKDEKKIAFLGDPHISRTQQCVWRENGKKRNWPNPYSSSQGVILPRESLQPHFRTATTQGHSISGWIGMHIYIA